MKSSITQCSKQKLEAFLAGDLTTMDEAELAAHVDQCADCQQLIESLAAEPNAWQNAQRFLQPTEFDQHAVDDTRPSLIVRQILDQLAPTDDPDMLGRLGTYEISGVIGAGGMGVVLKGIDRSLDRPVAIKVMAPHLAGSGAARQRFAREAKAAAAVMHPNVIAIHSVTNDDELPWLVMPYVKGSSLEKRVDRLGPLNVQEILRISSQVASGLAAAHAQGLVHRDIKPGNILLEEGVERVTITDFGLARTIDDATMTHSGMITGTPQYMSPEQARGDSVDARSDLFSLGSVMYTMCTGRAPFRAETTYGVIRRIVDESPRPIREVNADVPEWLCQIISVLMAKQPEFRFDSSESVAELLEQCLAHVQQPDKTPLPAIPRLAGQGTGSKTSASWLTPFNVFVGAVVLAMFAWAITWWQSGDPPDISGVWAGEQWDKVTLVETQDGSYKGTFARGEGEILGTLQLKWSRIEKRFNGSWNDNEDRKGKISIRQVDDEIHGARTTNRKSSIDESSPRLAELVWKRHDGTKILDDDTQDLTKNDPLQIPAGKKLIAIKVDLTNISNVPEPGMLVDVLAVFSADDSSGASPIAKILLSNIELSSIEIKDETSTAIAGLIVDETQSEKIVLAQSIFEYLTLVKTDEDRLEQTTDIVDLFDVIGRVVAIQDDSIVINVGLRAGVRVGDGIDVFRSGEYVGRAFVYAAEIRGAAARMDPQITRLQPKVGDVVTSADLELSKPDNSTEDDESRLEQEHFNQLKDQNENLIDDVAEMRAKVVDMTNRIYELEAEKRGLEIRGLQSSEGADPPDLPIAGGTTLADAVKQFNIFYVNHPIGRTQPRLTEDEVVAAMRWAASDRENDLPGMSDATFEEFQSIIDKRIIPENWQFEVQSKLGNSTGEWFDVWSIRLAAVKPDEFGQIESDYIFAIRSQVIGINTGLNESSDLTENENVQGEDASFVALDAAIFLFNQGASSVGGAAQPPLKLDEVVASIKLRRFGLRPLTASIADTQKLPEGYHLERLTKFDPGDGYRYWINSIRLAIPLESGGTTSHVIRNQFIRSEKIDENIFWGPESESGLQAGVVLEPAASEYKIGQIVETRFVVRNLGQSAISISFPRIMTHAYLKEMFAKNEDGPLKIIHQGIGGPVGWMSNVTLVHRSALNIKGPSIVIGGEADESLSASNIPCETGDKIDLYFTLPNLTGDDQSSELKTGTVEFDVARD